MHTRLRIERDGSPAAEIDAQAGRRKSSSSRVWLGVLMVWATLHVLTYNVVVPLWQVPDEPAHVEYACLLAQQMRGIQPETAQPALQQTIVRSLAAHQFWARVGQPLPAQLPDGFADDPFLRNAGRQRGDEPPLYYTVPALICGLPLPLSAQVHLMRLVSGLFFVLAVPVAWWAVRPLWPDRRTPVVAVAATMAALPMLAFLSAGVNNDSLVTLVGAATFALLVRLVRRPRGLLALAVVLASLVALFVKKTGVVLVPLAGVAAAWYLVQVWQRTRWRLVVVLVGLTLLLLALIPSPLPWGWEGRNQPWGVGRTPAAAHSGHYGVPVFDADSQGFGRLYQVVHWELLPALQGQTVRFGAWVRAAPGQTLRLAVRDDQQLGRVYGRGTGDWQWLEVQHTVAPGTTELRVLVSPGVGEVPAETGMIEVDDASLTLVGTAMTSNLLRNPGLERGTTWGSRLWRPLWVRYVQPWLRDAQPWLDQVRYVVVRPLRISWMAAQQAQPAVGPRCAGALCLSCTTDLCRRLLYAALLFPGFWGYFGWLQLPLPLPVYGVLGAASGLAVVGILGQVLRYRRLPPAGQAARRFVVRVARWAALAIALAALIVLLPLVVWGWQPQARYFYPVLVPVVFLGIAGLRFWSAHWQLRHGLAWYLGGLLLLDLYALLAIVIPAYTT